MMGLWAKITGLLSIVIGFLFMRNRIQANKIENMEADSKVKDRVIEVTNEMQDARDKLIKEAADEDLKNDGSDWDDGDNI